MHRVPTHTGKSQSYQAWACWPFQEAAFGHPTLGRLKAPSSKAFGPWLSRREFWIWGISFVLYWKENKGEESYTRDKRDKGITFSEWRPPSQCPSWWVLAMERKGAWVWFQRGSNYSWLLLQSDLKHCFIIQADTANMGALEWAVMHTVESPACHWLYMHMWW